MTRKYVASYSSRMVKQIACERVAEHAVNFQKQLVNGCKTPVFVDCHALQKDPAAWRDVIDALICRIDDSATVFEAVAGAHCSCPMLAQSIAYRIGVPFGTVFLTKTPNRDMASAEIFNGRRVLLVEDAVLTGRTSVEIATALRAAGAEVTHVATLVDFELDASKVALHAAGLQRIAALSIEDVVEEAVRQGRFNEAQVQEIRLRM